MKQSFLVTIALFACVILWISCNETARQNEDDKAETNNQNRFGGYSSQQEWGEHLVTLGACHDCHTPKKMTPAGPDFDSTRLLSGHPSDMPDLEVNRAEMERKGLAVTRDLTSWIGPWGISYAANLTSDSTGIGAWKESQFMYAIREGKFKGLPESRALLPPMPWNMYRHMSDDELKAVFAYLKSTRPIRNIVPAPKPPVGMAKK